MLGWGDDPRFRRATNPSVRNRIALQVHVGQAVLLEHFGGPIVGLLELRATRQAGPDAVGEILQIVHQLRVIIDLGDDLRIRHNNGIGFICRRSGRPCARA